jgi:TP901 family phage tail tape measure protein
MILDVKQAIAGYTAARAASVSTVTAMNRGGAVMVRTGALMAGTGLVIAAGIGVAVKAAADFEKQLDFFGAVSNTTAADMEKVSEKALQLGRDTRYSAGEIAESFIELGKSGVKAQQIVDGIGEAVANLGAAADIPLTQAANIIVSQVQTFGMAAQDAVKVADLLAGAANESMVEIQDLGVSLKYAGGVASALGIPFKDLNTALALLGKYGIKGSTAGTSLRQMMVSLVGNSKKATVTMKELGIITKDGANQFFDATGKLKPLPQVMDILNKSMEGLTQEQKINKLKTMFNVRALPTVLNLMKEGAAGFDAMSVAIEKTKAADVAAARLDNLSGDVEILKGNLETLAIQAGGPLQQPLRDLVQLLTKLTQWFGDLSPQTQQLIVKFLVFSAAALILMGTFVMIMGTILRFSAAIMDLVKAGAFLIRVVMMVGTAFKALGVAMMANPISIIIALIIALVAIFVYLWKNNETFRNNIKAIWAAIKDAVSGVIDWFKTLPAFFSNLWDSIKSKTSAVWNAITNFFTTTIPAAFTAAWTAIKTTFMNGVNAVVGFFSSLPGKFMAIAAAVVLGVVTFFQELPAKLGYWIGFAVGRMIRLWLDFQVFIITTTMNIIMGVVDWFKALPGRVWTQLQRLWNFIVKAWNMVKNFMFTTVPAIINSVLNWFSKLPGRVWNYLNSMYTRAKNSLSQLATTARQKASEVYNNIVNWITKLPGRIGEFFSRTYTNARNKLSQLASAARDFGSRIYRGVIDFVNRIPGAVGGAIGNAISAFKGMVSRAFNAAKDFAGGLWSGFKKGLGINSPSFIEKQMVQITRVVGEETNALKGQVRAVQSLGSHLTKIPHLEANEQTLATGAAKALANNLAAEAAKFSALQSGYAEILAKSNASQQAGANMAAQTAAQTAALRRPIDLAPTAPPPSSPDERPVNVEFKVFNPIAENSSETAVNEMTRVAALGVFG